MRRRFLTTICLTAIAGASSVLVRAQEQATAIDAASLEFFEKKIRPVLAERCLTCHGETKQKASLRLDSRESVLKGGETGPAAVPGKPAESLLVEAIHYGGALQMPPKSRLPEKEVVALTKWVEMGLPWPKETIARTSDTGSKPAFDLQARRKAHWAWQPIKTAQPPEVSDPSWPNGPVDRFILAKLDAKGLKPALEAGRVTLIRRLAFDLTGLPPTTAEVDAFVDDKRADAYERLVGRLLSSPRYGERWARHWLDLVRYAETRGHEFDPAIPNAWQYRDYLVRALNADVPYDAFLTEHLAGDLMVPPRLDPKSGANESILGTGFWFLGEEVHSPVDIRQDETDRLDNRLDVMSKTFMGLTVACARCHDHKFDAISQRDYYALSGFLISSTYRQVRFATMEKERRAAEALQSLHDRTRDKVHHLAAELIRAEIGRLPAKLFAARSVLLGGENTGKSVEDPAVKRWVEVLKRAKDDLREPMHTFASVACTASSEDAKDFSAQLHRALSFGRSEDGWLSSGDDLKLVTTMDFGDIRDLSQSQNGFAFGLRSASQGDLTLDGDPAHPTFGLFSKKAARHNSAFNGLTFAEGTERDHGKIGTWDRPGRTLRTHEFEIGSGLFYYLAKGAGHAYASVNSHLIVAGPLHGHVTTEWTDGGKGWRWVRHDLSGYAGHRAHIEFSPAGAGEFAIARVIQADRPPKFSETPNSLLITFLSDSSVDSPETLARAYQSLFNALSRRLDGARGDASEGEEDVARLGDFVLRNTDLFAPVDSAASRNLEAEVSKYATARRAIAESVAGPSPTALAIMDGNGMDEHLLIRGSSKTPGPAVPRRLLEAIASEPMRLDAQSGSGRLLLARQMTGPSNPFASRVIVNRIWYHLFGKGIVASVDNFGVLGEPPTHPELLDTLAERFMREGWSQKRLIRSLVMSRTYKMASTPDSIADLADPKNSLLHRREVRRLEAEPIRDAILAVSGRLEERIGGPSVPVYLTEAMQGRGRPAGNGPRDGDGRRSIYLGIRRNFLAPMMLAYDAPIPFNCVGRRNVSNVPAQALILMNDPFVVEQARLWSDQILEDPTRTPAGRVNAMYRQAFARTPSASEINEALAFLESQAKQEGSPDGWKTGRHVWADLAHVLFNTKEFVFVD